MIQAEENKAKIAKQIEEVRIFYPELEVISENNYDVVLAGELYFRAQYDNLEEIVDSYILRIEVPVDFSILAHPKVFEIAGKINRIYHRYISGALCFGVPFSVKMCLLEKGDSLLCFIENLLIPYLYAHSYYMKNKKMPFGHYGHSDDEFYFYYKKYFDGIPDERLLDFLLVAYRPSIYRMHRQCLCGSGKIMRKCHGHQIKLLSDLHPQRFLKQDIEKVVSSLHKRDVNSNTMVSKRLRSRIFNEYIKELEKDIKLQQETAKTI